MKKIFGSLTLAFIATGMVGCVTHFTNLDQAQNTQKQLYQDNATCGQEANREIDPFSQSHDMDEAVYVQKCLTAKGWRNDPNWRQNNNTNVL